MEQREICAGCGLWPGCLTPGMDGAGNACRPLLAFVDSAPSAASDAGRRCRPGATAESVLGAVLEASPGRGKETLDALFFTNAVRCRPPDGKPKQKHVRRCAEFLRDELAAVDPAVVVVAGNDALFALLGKKGIASLQGNWQTWKHPLTGREIPVLPTFSPTAAEADAPNGSRYQLFATDLENAWRRANGQSFDRLPAVDYRVAKTPEDLAAIRDAADKGERCAWDIETNTVRPHAAGAKVLCVQFSFAPGAGWLVPVDHPQRAAGLRREAVLETLRHVLEDAPCKLVGQNLKFDSGFVRRRLGIKPRTPAMDTFIAHHILFEEESQRGGNGLKVMARKFTALGGYERPVEEAYPNFYGRMEEVPLEADAPGSWADLKHYAVGDTDATLQIAERLRQELAAQGLEGVLALELEKQELLTKIEAQGAAVDWDLHADYLEAFPAALGEITERLRAFPEAQAVEERLTKVTELKTKTKVERPDFNANSTRHVAELALRVLGLPADPERVTATGAPKMDREVMEDWIAAQPEGSTARTMLGLIIAQKRLSKLYGTYIEPLARLAGEDGRIHATFNAARVTSYRLSCSEPNHQNLPRDSGQEIYAGLSAGDVKRLYVAPARDWSVAEVDLSQIELRIAALISQDSVMLDNLGPGKDLHRVLAGKVFGKAPEDITKNERTDAKRANFGYIYGISAPALARNIRIPLERAQNFIAGCDDLYRGFVRWSDATRRELLDRGYVESLFGHRRRPSDLRSRDEAKQAAAIRSGINFPIQCTASNLTLYALCDAAREIAKRGLRARFFGTVHDSVWVTFPDEELDLVIPLVIRRMENYQAPFLTGKDPRFPRVPPIFAEASVGDSLGELEDYEPTA